MLCMSKFHLHWRHCIVDQERHDHDIRMASVLAGACTGCPRHTSSHCDNSPVNLAVATGLLVAFDDMQGACTNDRGH